MNLIFPALLLATARGTWLSARWRASQTEPPPVPLDETILDKIADRFPLFVWPYGRPFYYFIAVGEALVVVLAIIGRNSRG